VQAKQSILDVKIKTANHAKNMNADCRRENPLARNRKLKFNQSQIMANGRYKVEYAETALENLRSLPKREADQILRKVLRLEHGLHGNIKRLQNADAGFRLRMGDYRVLFDVIGDRIVIQKVGNRKDVYD
jgi:mRNA interferase RelE/StbE